MILLTVSSKSRRTRPYSINNYDNDVLRRLLAPSSTIRPSHSRRVPEADRVYKPVASNAMISGHEEGCPFLEQDLPQLWPVPQVVVSELYHKFSVFAVLSSPGQQQLQLISCS